MISRRKRVILPLLLVWAMIGCREQRQSDLPTVRMRLGEKEFTLEVAATPESRERGLMRRDSMPADHGMIFVFDDALPLTFHMKNTRIPLDIVFLDEQGKVVSIKQMRPYDESTTPSDAPAKWAIELNQGAAEKAGLKVGEVVAIPPAARSPPK